MEDTHRTALAHLWLAVEAELPIGSIEPEATFDYLFDRLITIALVKRVDPAYMAEAMRIVLSLLQHLPETSITTALVGATALLLLLLMERVWPHSPAPSQWSQGRSLFHGCSP
jgi:hypothetical protein